MSCGCGLEWSSRRPWRAGPRSCARSSRFLRTAGERRRGGQDVRPVPARRGLLGRVPLALPRADDRRALVDRARVTRSTSPPPTGSSFFRNHGMLGLRRHRWRTVTGGSRDVRARRCSPRSAAHAAASTRPVRSVAPHDGRGRASAAPTTPSGAFDGGRDRDAARRARSLCSRTPPPEERRAAVGAFETTANETVLHTDAATRCRVATFGSLLVELPVARLRRATPQRPSLTYSLNRLQRLDDARRSTA